MNVSNNFELTLSNLDGKEIAIDKFLIIEGIGGMLPEMHVTVAIFDDQADGEELDVTLILNGSQKLSTKAFIFSRKVVNNTKLDLKMYLCPKDFVYTQLPATYESIDDAISALWTGKKENIKPGGKFLVNQMSRSNSKFLTDCLLSIQENFNFCYEMTGTLNGIDMSDHAPDINLDDTDEYHILGKELGAEYNPLQDLEITNEGILATGVVSSNVDHYCDQDALSYYNNISMNKALQFRHNESQNIQYFNYGSIRIGDIIELRLNSTKKDKYRAFFTQIKWINKELSVITQVSKINE